MLLTEMGNRRLTVFFVWLTLAAAGVYLFIFEPGKSGFFPVCPFRALTGFACPGCGSGRALHALLHGDLATAFALNPLLVLSLPFLLYALVRHTRSVLLGQPMRSNMLPASSIYALFGIVLCFWILRNSPLYPFPS